MSTTNGFPGDSGFIYKKSPPSSFSDYLKAYGTDSNKNFEEAMNAASQSYGQSVKVANDDYYRSLMTYGQNAEALSAGGLTGAGVSNYGDHAAYAARQGAVATAGATKQLAAAVATATKKAEDRGNAASYAGYLRGYYSGESAKEEELKNNRSNTLLGIYNSGETDASQISLLLTNSGYFNAEEIPALAEQYATANLGRQKSDLATGIHQQIVDDGIYDEATIRARYSTIPGLTQEELDQYVANTVAAMSGVAAQAQKDNELAKSTAKGSVYMSFYGKQNVTLDAIKLALGAQNVVFEEGEIETAAQEIYDRLNEGQTVDNGTFLEATAFYNEMLGTGNETYAKTLTENKYGVDMANQVVNAIKDAEEGERTKTIQETIKTFSDTVNALDANGFAVAYGTDAEGNEVSVDLLDQLELFKKNGYFEGNEAEYERLKGEIQNHNFQYLSNFNNLARDEWKVDKLIGDWKLDIPEDADEEDKMSMAVKAVAEKVYELFEAGKISHNQASDILLESFEYDLEAILETSGRKGSGSNKVFKDVWAALLDVKVESRKIGSDEHYNRVMDMVLDNIEITQDERNVYMKIGDKSYYISWQLINKQRELSAQGKKLQGTGPVEKALAEAWLDMINYWEETQNGKN